MRLLVCGSRDWDDHLTVRGALLWLEPDTVIHGDCKGADKIAGEEATDLMIEVVSYPAQWGKYGKAAGPIRNQLMLDEGKPDCVAAFHSDLAASRGTADMVKRAQKAKLVVVLFPPH